MNVKTSLAQAAISSALIAVVIFASGATIYFNNLSEYSFTCSQFVTGMGVVVTFGFLSLFALQACFIKTKLFRWLFLTVFSIGLCMWFQGNFIFYPRGLAGDAIRTFGHYPVYGIWELLFYTLIFCLVFYFRNFVQSYCFRVLIVVAATQLITTFPAIISYDPILLRRIPSFDWPTQNSKEENITIILVDSTGTDFFDKLRKTFPEYDSRLKDFEYFNHLLSIYPQTLFAVPTILSGSSFFDNTKQWNPLSTVWNQSEKGFQAGFGGQQYIKEINQMYQDCNSLIPNLSNLNYLPELYPYIGLLKYTPQDYEFNNLKFDNDIRIKRYIFNGYMLSERIIPFSFYRVAPLIIKDQTIKFIDDTLMSIYGLIKNTHKVVLKSSAFSDKGKKTEIKLISGDKQFLDIKDEISIDKQKRFRFIHLIGCHVFDDCPEDAYLPYGKLLFDGLLNYLDYLKKNDCYDNSWIIIMGDHGQHTGKIQYRFNPIFLIKRPHDQSETMQINENVILMRDIAPSLLGELGVQTERPFSIWNQTEEQKKERQELWQKLFIGNAQ